MRQLSNHFFEHDASVVAKALLGKVLRHRVHGQWLSAQIIETEAYYIDEKGSHASLGFTQKRRALFMLPGTIYMYYARGSDSFNVSVAGEGNAVLFKSAIPYVAELNKYTQAELNANPMIQTMLKHNPIKHTNKRRKPLACCSGQTLLCKSLLLSVPDWDQKCFCRGRLELVDVGYQPRDIIKTTRLGIPAGRDAHLMLRYIDKHYVKYATSNPLSKRQAKKGQTYFLLNQ